MSDNKRMQKNISFRHYEKDLYDYINDKTKVPDLSMFIKQLIRNHIENETNTNPTSNTESDYIKDDVVEEQDIKSEDVVSEKAVIEQKNQETDILDQDDNTYNEENITKQDLYIDENEIETRSISDENDKLLQDLDL